ncbi:TIGR02117 family protein [Planctomycetes bacterium K23_9]|uniref:TIGR02117 family protein n=1 Tax=Stieleria marina TaxID=1930275 RepID=A0A517P0U0_9BACT|nr:hypothetical protein K239x_49970 [Planctomycetes bacterium K23_9]
MAATEPTTPLRRRSPVRQFLRLVKCLAKCVFVLSVVYLAIVLVGLSPVHSDFHPSDDGIDVAVVSNAVHADLILPVSNAVIDWREVFPPHCFPVETAAANCITIGWGDKGFFLYTKNWGDLKLSVAAKALLWPSDTCVHVTMKQDARSIHSAKSVRISPQQYQQLVDSICQSLKLDEHGQAIRVDGFHYGQLDAFFDARGTYHCLNTCNSWVGRKLQAAGVKTPWFSPLPKTVNWYFPQPVQDPA